MNNVKIRFNEENVYVSVNNGEWLVENWTQMSPITRILIRSVSGNYITNIDCEEIPFE